MELDTVFIALLLSAIYSSSALRQFEFVQMSMNCTEAQRYCREKYSDLASIDSIADVTELLKSVTEARVWIGLMETPRSEWKWSLGDPAFYKANDALFRNWAFNQPNNGLYYCTYMSQDGLWHDDYCNSQRFFICYNDQFILIKQNLSWSEAMTYCRQNHMDLVSVPSPQIEQRVMSAARRASTAAVWMGLHHYCIMNMWLWLHGEVVCYQNWAAGNGTGLNDCSERRVGAIQSSGGQRWVSLPPTIRLNFICTNSEA